MGEPDPTLCPLCQAPGYVDGVPALNCPPDAPPRPHDPLNDSPPRPLAPYQTLSTIGPTPWYRAHCSRSADHTVWLVNVYAAVGMPGATGAPAAASPPAGTAPRPAPAPGGAGLAAPHTGTHIHILK
jgi:hypothetical protein